jgi:hypothetical protein
MRKIEVLSTAMCAVLVLSLPGTPARANDVSFVAQTGTDTSNGCGDPTHPCRTFAKALTTTDLGGTITCVSSGSFDTYITIAQSVIIDCGGAVINTFGFTVSGNNIVVKLRNLTMNGLAIGFSPTLAFGIRVTSVAELSIENCTIRGFQNSDPAMGIQFVPTNSGAKLFVTDSIISNNGTGSSNGGIVIQPTGSGAQVVIDRTRLENNTTGILADGTGSAGPITVVIRDSVVTNGSIGISANTATSPVTVSLDHSHVSNNTIVGIQAIGAAVILNNSTVQTNNTGLAASGGGAIFSYGNNPINGNQPGGIGTAPIVIGLH